MGRKFCCLSTPKRVTFCWTRAIMASLTDAMVVSFPSFRPLQCKGRNNARAVMSTFPFQGATYRQELEAAVNVVERACLLCNLVRNSMNGTTSEFMQKTDLSPVTVADFGVQSLISLELGLRFPSIPLVAEEDGTYLKPEFEEGGQNDDKQDLLCMIVDCVSKVASPNVQPITSNSVLEAIHRGAPDHCVRSTQEMSSFWIGLSLVVDGKVVLGVMGCPCLTHANMASSVSGRRLIWAFDKVMSDRIWSNTGILVVAHKGCGTWLRSLNIGIENQWKNLTEQNFVQSFVDSCMTVNEACFGLSRHETWRSSLLASIVPTKKDGHVAFHFCCGSLCKYLAVAVGAVSAVLLHQTQKTVKVWDHAPGVICVKEAGGKTTDGEGFDLERLIRNGERTFMPSRNSIVVSNGHLHETLIKHLLK
ncbi:hypothetical protein KP509_01G129600 [Ceratopteris richardii]|uniref:Inositol polyphosphate 1-phosphatase n=1 Tax=Ceratopteris richardii TaxID=49495 RepID=A0A8T2VR84_CERRI|nr:hypothetical protein KP509_01G129600 [Ceratopteris richardii]